MLPTRAYCPLEPPFPPLCVADARVTGAPSEEIANSSVGMAAASEHRPSRRRSDCQVAFGREPKAAMRGSLSAALGKIFAAAMGAVAGAVAVLEPAFEPARRTFPQCATVHPFSWPPPRSQSFRRIPPTDPLGVSFMRPPFPAVLPLAYPCMQIHPSSARSWCTPWRRPAKTI